jgi:putative phosphoribosyl transferase
VGPDRSDPPQAVGGQQRRITVEVDCAAIEGDLVVPEEPRGVVVFAHGSGSSRRSPRNRQVARTLSAASLATLLIDLLTAEEEQLDMQTGEVRFDIGLLGARLSAASGLLSERPETASLPLGYFGASTGAAAALIAAAERTDAVRAVVSRGGRPDLAGDALGRVRAPTLLIVGERDPQVLDTNRHALAELTSESRLEVVPHATHLFEESGALERVSELACDWFGRWFRGGW